MSAHRRAGAVLPLLVGFLFGCTVLTMYSDLGLLKQASTVDPEDPFPEPPWDSYRTLGRRTVVSSEFARFEVHHVRTEDGSVVKDWLWTDETSHVNILVHLRDENKYMLFRQTKYGLESPKYATVGGLFNAGESPEACANRELLEETGLLSETMVKLGSYRVQADRGGGVLHAFLARNCYFAPEKDRRKSDDYEKQSVHKFSLEELIELLRQGDIGEAQWLATTTLGVLHNIYKPKKY